MKIIVTIESYVVERIKSSSSELHEDFFIKFNAHIKYAGILENKMKYIGSHPYIGDGLVLDYYYESWDSHIIYNIDYTQCWQILYN